MKRSRLVAILAIVSVLALAGGLWMFQSGYLRQAPPAFAPPYPSLDANGAPVMGVFEGRTPCADCEKIKMALALYENRETKEPSTYWLARVYGGKSDDRVVTEGTWSKRRGTREYPDAVVYELDSSTPEDLRRYWRISEEIMLPLDRDMNLKAGNASWGYMLSRTR
jgi:hypothetical protein